jgi:type I restriction enzyme, S subunit
MSPLGDVATLQRGFDLPVQDRREGMMPIFAANGPVGTHNVRKVCGPGVVTGRSGTLGKVHFVNEDYWPLNTALWVKDFHGNDPAWVYRLLTWMRLEQYTRGAGVPTLNRNLVHVVEVPLPPLAEQKRIAGILDAADALRAKRRESLVPLDTLVQSTFLDMFGDLVTNPMGWGMKPLGDVATLQRGFDLPVQERREGRVPIYAANGPVGTHEVHKVTGPGVVTGRSGTLGKVHYVEGDFWPLNTALWVKDFHSNDPVWVCQLLRLMRLEQFTRGAGVPTLNRNLVHVVEVPRPAADLQNRFAAIVESIEQQKASQRAHLDELDTLFASLQSRAFRGDL